MATQEKADLEDMILECGKMFMYLTREHDGTWRATAADYEKGSPSCKFSDFLGKTPKEAVERLIVNLPKLIDDPWKGTVYERKF